jgi:hypothetical protein
MDFGSHRKRRWYRAVVGSVAGATGLAAVSVLAGATPFSSPDRPESRQAAHGSTDQGRPAAGARRSTRPRARVADTSGTGLRSSGDKDGPHADAGAEEESAYGRDHDGNGYDTTDVPCDPDELIEAIRRANGHGGDKLVLAEGCTYTLTATGFGNGLPSIVQPVKIDGNGATIVRAANAERFRIFHVGVGGNLTLRNLTIKGGDTVDDGGALLVQEGGKASVEDSKLAFNHASGNGGAIANFGITKVGGESYDEHGDGKGKDSDHDAEGGKDAATGDQWWSGDESNNDEWGKDEWGKDKESNASTELTDNSAANGGAVYNAGALTIKDARLSYNSAQSSGGGLDNEDVAKLTRTEVDHNFAGSGGGIRAGGVTKLSDASVHDNTAAGLSGGGGVFVAGNGQLFLNHSSIRRNTTEGNGGGVFNFNGDVAADESEINSNTAYLNGGGVGNLLGPVSLRRTELNENHAAGPESQGGGLFNNGGGVTFTDSEVKKNVSTEAPGGIYTNNSGVSLDEDTEVIKNRPTNCQGSPAVPPQCFG